MSKFKVGDKVRLTGRGWDGGGALPSVGEVVTVDGHYPDGTPKFHFKGMEFVFPSSPRYSAELVEQKPDIETFAKSIADTMKEHFGGAEDPISPSYYQFPNGVQVRDISKYLTSFGGQALQYVARSTRLDGNNKGDRIENLRKAIEMIQWEIERIEEEQA